MSARPSDFIKRYRPLHTPLAIFVGCLAIAIAIYASGGITVTVGGARKTAEDAVVAGEEERPVPDIPSYDSDVLDRFAQCLTERGAKLYVASGCGYCQQQKELFGESIQHIEQIECSDESPGGGREACTEVEPGLEGVPTWIFEDGTRLIGLQYLEALSEETGCPLQ